MLDMKNIPIKVMELSVDEWISFKEHNRERDFEQRAKKANAPGGHLHELAATHRTVNGAIVNGEYRKVDGHTRAYLWDKNLLERPKDGLIANMYLCDSHEQFIELYKYFDSKKTVDTSADLFYGAQRENEMLDVISSTLVKRGNLPSVYKIHNAGKTRYDLFKIYEYTAKLKPAMLQVDALNFKSAKYNVGAYAAMLLTFILYGNNSDGEKVVSYFWKSVDDQSNIYGGDDGINGVLAAMMILQDFKVNKGQDRDALLIKLCGQLLLCFENYKNNIKISKITKLKVIDNLPLYIRKQCDFKTFQIICFAPNDYLMEKIAEENAELNAPKAAKKKYVPSQKAMTVPSFNL